MRRRCRRSTSSPPRDPAAGRLSPGRGAGAAAGPRWRLTAVSGVSTRTGDAAYVRWLERVAAALGTGAEMATGAAPRPVAAADLPPALAGDWGDWAAPQVLWLPLVAPDGTPVGGLWIARDRPFDSGGDGCCWSGWPMPTPIARRALLGRRRRPGSRRPLGPGRGPGPAGVGAGRAGVAGAPVGGWPRRRWWRRDPLVGDRADRRGGRRHGGGAEPEGRRRRPAGPDSTIPKCAAPATWPSAPWASPRRTGAAPLQGAFARCPVRGADTRCWRHAATCARPSSPTPRRGWRGWRSARPRAGCGDLMPMPTTGSAGTVRDRESAS